MENSENISLITISDGNKTVIWQADHQRKRPATGYYMERRVVTKELRQNNDGDCGIVCLRIVGEYFGLDTEKLKDFKSGDILHGIDAGTMKELAMETGLSFNGFQLPLSDLVSLSFPQIVLINKNHYIVLEDIGEKEVHINDPACGRKTFGITEFKDMYSGVAFKTVKTGECVGRNNGNVEKLGKVVYGSDNTRKDSQDLNVPPASLNVSSLSYSFGKRKFFDNLDFFILPGETVAFVGSLAAGKTTLLKILAGKLEFDSGKVQVGTTAAKLGYVCEKPEFGDATLREILNADGGNESNGEQAAAALYDADILDRIIECGARLDTKISELNPDADMKKQLAIAAELVKEPEILIIDTLPETLDAKELGNILKRLKLRGCTLIIGSSVKDAVSTAGRLFVLSKGKLVQTVEKGRMLVESTKIELGKRDSFLCENGRASSLIESGRVFVYEKTKDTVFKPVLVAHAGDIIPDGRLIKAANKAEILRVPDGLTSSLEEHFRIQCKAWQEKRKQGFLESYRLLSGAGDKISLNNRKEPQKTVGTENPEADKNITTETTKKEQNQESRNLSELETKILDKIENGELFAGTIFENVVLMRTDISEEDVKAVLYEQKLGGLLGRLPMGVHTLLSEDGFGISAGERKGILQARKYFKERYEK